RRHRSRASAPSAAASSRSSSTSSNGGGGEQLGTPALRGFAVSNDLAIAAVTETLRFILDPPVAASVATATAKALRPDDASLTGPLVNIYLYQVTPNPSWRNDDLPTRSADGTIVQQRPRAALDLHYLLTFHGDDAKLEPQR